MLTPEQIQKNWNTYMNTRATPEQIAHTEACRAKRRLILELNAKETNEPTKD